MMMRESRTANPTLLLPLTLLGFAALSVSASVEPAFSPAVGEYAAQRTVDAAEAWSANLAQTLRSSFAPAAAPPADPTPCDSLERPIAITPPAPPRLARPAVDHLNAAGLIDLPPPA